MFTKILPVDFLSPSVGIKANVVKVRNEAFYRIANDAEENGIFISQVSKVDKVKEFDINTFRLQVRNEISRTSKAC